MEFENLAFVVGLFIVITLIFAVGFIILTNRVQAIRLKKQKEIYDAILTTQENEQQRIGSDLHDEVSPNLAIVRLKLGDLKEKLPSELFGNINQIEELISNTNNLVRKASHNLKPSTLKQNANNAFKSLCLNYSTQKFKVNYTNTFDLDKLSEQQKLHVYRITKELLHNALKHSNGSTGKVVLSETNGVLNCLVTDNGNNFKLNIANNGIGLENVKSRVDFLKGQLNIGHSETGGAQITFTISY